MITIPIKRGVDETVFEQLVDRVRAIKNTNPSADTSLLESDIDRHLYQIYGLTYEEVLIVDPNTIITREEYEATR